jgi:TolB protein
MRAIRRFFWLNWGLLLVLVVIIVAVTLFVIRARNDVPEPIVTLVGLVSYQTNANGNIDIVSQNLETNAVEPIVESAGDDIHPAWDSSGSQLLYAAFDVDNFNIVIVQRGSTLPQRLSTHPANDSYPAWSPDKSRMAFVRDGTLQIMGSNGRDLISPVLEVIQVESPSWSPDGTQIVFSSVADSARDIYTYNINSGSLRQLTNDGAEDLQPSWSPDGNRIAFSSNRGGYYAIYILQLGVRQTTRQITNLGDDSNPEFAPDGERLLFTSRFNGNKDIFVTNLQNGEIAAVTTSPAEEDFAVWQASSS